MSIEKKPPVPSLLVTTEPPIVVKNEPLEPEIVEIGIDDILGSSDEEISSDIKDIDIVEHILCEDTIKTETVPKNILESKHSKSMETQIIVKTENVSFVKAENLTESENLNKTEDASKRNVSRGTGPGVEEIQGSNEYFNAVDNLETDELVINFADDLNDISIRSGKPEHHKKTDFVKSYRTSETTSLKGDKEKIKVIKAPVVPVELHEYTSLSKDKYVCNYCQLACNKLRYVKDHISRMHRQIITMYQCSNCPFQSKWRPSVRNHIIQEHKYIKDIQWFQCHLCDKKFKLKYQLARHILTHEQRLELCPVCGKGFATKPRVKVHVRFVHNKEPPKRLKCHECEYTSLRKERLRYHIKTNHGKTKNTLIRLKLEGIQYFCCYHCSYKSSRKDTLKCHIFRHFKKEEIKFQCYICDFMTLKRDLITEHIRKHSQVQEES